MSTPWTDVLWDAPRPDDAAVGPSLAGLRFTAEAITSPAVLQLLKFFNTLTTNGVALGAALRVDDVDEVGQWFLSRNRFEEYGFVQRLLTSEVLAEALPDLVADGPVRARVEFEESSPLTLDGDIAEALLFRGGGAFAGTAAEAKQLGVAVSSELIGDRYEEFRVDISDAPWSPWFGDICWDYTWVITDLRDQRVTLITITDTE